MESVDCVWNQSCGLMKIPQSGVKEGTGNTAGIAKNLFMKKEMARTAIAHEAKTFKMVDRSTDQEIHY